MTYYVEHVGDPPNPLALSPHVPRVDADLQPGDTVVCSCGTVWKFATYIRLPS